MKSSHCSTSSDNCEAFVDMRTVFIAIYSCSVRSVLSSRSLSVKSSPADSVRSARTADTSSSPYPSEASSTKASSCLAMATSLIFWSSSRFFA
jgi:hypothetical protein